MLRLAVFEGDGIGPEICDVAIEVLESLRSIYNLDLEWARHPCGLSAVAAHGSTFPEASMQAARAADGILLGPLTTMEYPALGAAGVNASAWLRHALDLYANVRPSRARSGLDAANPALDVVVMRENTEGFYAVRTMHAGSGEFAPDPDSAFALRKITYAASHRIATMAFQVARGRPRRAVTAVHKANVLKLSDGLFLRACRDVARENPEVGYAEEIVDAVAAKLVRRDNGYDVLLTTNMFGDILSNQAAELAGGIGLAGSLNVGDHHALAQAAHGSAPDLAGRDLANPVSILLSLAMLLGRWGERAGAAAFVQARQALEASLERSLRIVSARTRDVGGEAGTSEVGAWLVRDLAGVRAEAVR